jgi:hypothetical protein
MVNFLPQNADELYVLTVLSVKLILKVFFTVTRYMLIVFPLQAYILFRQVALEGTEIRMLIQTSIAFNLKQIHTSWLSQISYFK